jgi:hypothetical protein
LIDVVERLARHLTKGAGLLGDPVSLCLIDPLQGFLPEGPGCFGVELKLRGGNRGEGLEDILIGQLGAALSQIYDAGYHRNDQGNSNRGARQQGR